MDENNAEQNNKPDIIEDIEYDSIHFSTHLETICT